MTDAQVINLVFLAMGVLMILIAVPMALEKIKPNNLYGFRTKKTLSDPKIWYAANRAAGIDMIYAGVVMILAAIGIYFFAGNLDKDTMAFAFLGVTTVTIASVTIHSFLYLRKL